MQWIPCESDEEKQKMIDFVLKHRQEINASYDVKTTFFSLGTQLLHGAGLAAINSQSQIVGYIGVMYGTPENQFLDSNKARIEMVYIKERYRCTPLFFKGMQLLIDQMNAPDKRVTHIEFYVPNENKVLKDICSRFPMLETESKSNFGTEIHYLASMESMSLYLKKMQIYRKARMRR